MVLSLRTAALNFGGQRSRKGRTAAPPGIVRHRRYPLPCCMGDQLAASLVVVTRNQRLNLTTSGGAVVDLDQERRARETQGEQMRHDQAVKEVMA